MGDERPEMAQRLGSMVRLNNDSPIDYDLCHLPPHQCSETRSCPQLCLLRSVRRVVF